MKSVRIYGFNRDFGSYAQVTRGFFWAFFESGWSAAELDLYDLESEPSFDEDPTGLPLADVAILTGPPVAATVLTTRTQHERRFVMVAPNSDKLPPRTMHTVNQHATHILSPSAWGKTVLEAYTDKPVIVVPHGISQDFRFPGRDSTELLHKAYDSGEFKILHLSSSDGQRKGTAELCRAFCLAVQRGFLPPRSELRLVLTPAARGQLIDTILSDPSMGSAAARITLLNRFNSEGADPVEMAQIYGTAHVVCQPSRGEGFGLVPLEALASGTPVIATATTGHTEWFADAWTTGALVEVPMGEMAPIDDMGGATAPSLSVPELVAALRLAHQEWVVLKTSAIGSASALGERWSWKKKLTPFIEMVKG